jgi:hypothetical protein
MTQRRDILSVYCLGGDNPTMVHLADCPWGYQCSVPAEWLKEWLDLPEGGTDKRQGKAWWYKYPEDQASTEYQVERRKNFLHIDVQVNWQPSALRCVAVPIAELRHWFTVKPRMYNLAENNCYVPKSWLAEWLKLPEGGQDERMGKNWGYEPPIDKEKVIYRAKRLGGYLIIESKEVSYPKTKRMAVMTIANVDLRDGD